jgi:lysophospholipase L1-like esterase
MMSSKGPNLLWHIQNGLISNLNPKLWFVSIGSNDLFLEKCTDRFVVASILNVIKMIHDTKPESRFIIHGILPRKDNPKSKSQFLKKKWKYAQAINSQIRKFCEHSPRLWYMQAGSLFLEETESKGRRQIDEKLLKDGVHPTEKGLEVWGDYMVKRMKEILQEIEHQKTEGLTESTRHLRSLPAANFSTWTIPKE